MARPKESDREDIRAKVLETAKELFLNEGYNRITMRRIATKIGYSPTAIYLYFKNKEEILYELHNEGFRILYTYKQKMVEGGMENAFERLKMGGMMYIDFAMENPDYYDLMFNMPEPRNYIDRKMAASAAADPSKIDYAMRSYYFLKQSILQCQAEGYLTGFEPDTAAFSFWSFVHGLVALIIRKRVPAPHAPTPEFAYAAIDMMMHLVASDRFTAETFRRMQNIPGTPD